MERLKVFCKRGVSGMWIGPLLMILIWLILKKMNLVTYITPKYFVIAVLGIIAMSFVTCGVTIVYQLPSLSKKMAVMIHVFVIFLDFFIIYECNQWMHTEKFSFFAGAFIHGFVVAWSIAFLWIKFWKDIKKAS